MVKSRKNHPNAMPSPREISLGIFLSYLKEWMSDAGVPWTGHGQYELRVGVANDKITSLKLAKANASINLK